MTTLEIAEELSERGWEVWIYSHLANEPMVSLAERLPNVHVIRDPYEEISVDVDLIWIHHTTLPDNIINFLTKAPVNTKIIWLHMSIWVHMEMPMFPEIETKLADSILAISEAVGASIVKFGIDESRVEYFRNPAPRLFYKERANSKRLRKLRSLLIVTNHLTEEQKVAISLLKQSGVKVHVTGEQGEPELVRSSLIGAHDAVMTIGKTVQYALAMGVPVYLYDHNGGPGWLQSTSKIIELEKNHFRGTTYPEGLVEQKNADELVSELTDGYAKTNKFMKTSKDDLMKRYSLKKEVDKILSAPSKIKRITFEEAEILKNFNEFHRGLYRTLEYERTRNKKEDSK